MKFVLRQNDELMADLSVKFVIGRDVLVTAARYERAVYGVKPRGRGSVIKAAKKLLQAYGDYYASRLDHLDENEDSEEILAWAEGLVDKLFPELTPKKTR